MVGYITSYDSFATLEGPGIRFAIFMSGCNLRCIYCHNPDTWQQGKPIEAQDLVKTISRYKPYFRGGGGVTFSGGEPLMQTDFVTEAAIMLKEQGIHIALDTSCGILTSKQKELYKLCDLVIADLKFTNAKQYAQFCKNDVFDTVIATLRYLNQQNIPIWLRIVIVPDINDSITDINNYYEIIKGFTNIRKLELKPFHTMGYSKYQQLGIDNPLAETNDLPLQKLDELQKHLDSLMQNKI